MVLNLINEPPPIAAVALGTATTSHRGPVAARRMARVTIPLLDSDNFRLGDPVTVLDSGTGQAERCQVESWVMPWPSGNEKVIRVHYPAVLPANNTRIVHTFERSSSSAAPSFVWHPAVLDAWNRMGMTFFFGPKTTHWVRLENPTLVVNGERAKRYRFFARLYEPSHAPTLRTQYWVEVFLWVYSGMPYMLGHVHWGVDDPRVNWDGEERAGLSDADTEVGMDLFGPYQNLAQLQPVQPHTNTQSLTWIGDRWRWIWDRRTLCNDPALTELNHRIPWGAALKAQFVVLCDNGTLTQADADSLQSWRQVPFYHAAQSNEWVAKAVCLPARSIMRRRKPHETPLNLTAAQVRQRLETEAWTVAQARSVRGNGAMYAWDHAVGIRDRAWHNPDGQGPGAHGWWRKQPHLGAILHSVPDLFHAYQAGTYICPWFYAYKEVDGRFLSSMDHPEIRNNRGNPFIFDGGGYAHGKQFALNGWTSGALPRWTRAAQANLLRYPSTNTSQIVGLVGTDNAHYEAPHLYVGAALWGDDGWRETAYSITVLLHASGSYADVPRGVGEVRNWSRSARMWAFSIWMFGGEEPRLIHFCADRFYGRRTRPTMDAIDATWPGRKIKTVTVEAPAGNVTPTQVRLANYTHWRPWELVHMADGELAIAQLAQHVRPELAWFAGHAREVAESVLRYGSMILVDEETGQISYELITFRGIRGVALAIAWMDGGTRQLTLAELQDNNSTRCNWPPSGDPDCPEALQGYMKVPFFGDSADFSRALQWMALDGPLSVGDVTLTRYVPANEVTGLTPLGAGATPWIDWYDSSHRWVAHRVDIVNQSAATRLGTHGVNLRGLAASQLTARNVWSIQPDQSLVARRNVDTGALLEGQNPTPWMAEPTNLTTFTLGGVAFVALLKSAGVANTGHRILITPESGLLASIPADWTFTLPGGDVADVRAICWAPQLARFVIAGHSLTGATVWTLAIGDRLARRVSLFGTPKAQAQIIVDLAQIEHATATPDGVLMVLTSTTGERHAYIWNSESLHWGCPRHKFTGDTWAALSAHGRDDDNLRIFTATDLGTYWEHAI